MKDKEKSMKHDMGHGKGYDRSMDEKSCLNHYRGNDAKAIYEKQDKEFEKRLEKQVRYGYVAY